ncbi:hypothetical protein CDD82_998 [Ophiocordyceps australis]|uniref:N-acetyltransferase domain-containing protein n=1 Tax=Ophiocordyceps australis TaxID=1399860 RepID=A0A2C5ZJW6_9HYPO|nr:hypothetical protein CDD82_998 [Ophiocordyceps australis]
MASLQSGIVLPFDCKAHAHLTPYLAALQASCITYDGTMMAFVPPLSHEKLLSWWKERMAEVGEGKRLIWILTRPRGSGSDTAGSVVSGSVVSGSVPQGPDIVGVVMLALPSSETAASRGSIESLLVHQSFRGRRGATALLQALERDAAKLGRTLLLLHAEAQSPGHQVCRHLGYVEAGIVPKYGISPRGELRDSVLLYKQL